MQQRDKIIWSKAFICIYAWESFWKELEENNIGFIRSWDSGWLFSYIFRIFCSKSKYIANNKQ